MRSRRPCCFSHPTTAATSRERNCLWKAVIRIAGRQGVRSANTDQIERALTVLLTNQGGEKMNGFLKYITICVFVSSTHAFAEDLSSATDPLPPGTFTSHQHSDEWLIKNALSAGPDWITDKATVA